MIECDDEPSDEEKFETLCEQAREADWTYNQFMLILKDHGLQRFAHLIEHASIH